MIAEYKRVLVVALVIVLIGIGALTSSQRVSADTFLPASPSISLPEGCNPECWPLDVVVLIDESLSMSKADGNDPEGYRFMATEELLKVLIVNRRAQCNEAVHRLGVIYFTDVVTTVVPLEPIDIPTTGNRDDWPKYNELIQAIDAGMPYKYKNGTNPALAFEAADKLLSQAEHLPTPPRYGPRRQVVILLTDGNPEGLEVGRLDQYMRRLSEDLQSPSWRNRSIWIVALNAKEDSHYLDREVLDGKTMREVWREIAEAHHGQLLSSEYNANTILTALDTIIYEEFGQPGERIQCGDFYVKPYLQSVRFIFSKRLEHRNDPIILSKLDDETGEVLYRYAGGEVDMAPSSPSMEFRDDLYRREEIVEEYVFDFPLPGRWHFTLEGVDEDECCLIVDARQIPRTANVNLIEPSGVVAQNAEPPYYDTEAPLPLKLRLESVDGKPITPLQGYPLTLTATLTLPSGARQLPDGSPVPTYTFELVDDNLWQSNPAYIVAPEVGTYTLNVYGVSEYKDPPEECPVITATLSYQVKKLGQLRFKIQSPVDGEVIPCNMVQDRRSVGNPVPVTVQLFDPNGEAADPGFYLTSDPNRSFEATLFDAGDNPLDTVWLAPTSQIGLFEGRLMESITNVVGCGDVSVRVVFTGTVDGSRFVLPLRERTVSFHRPQSEGVLVVPSSPAANATFPLHPDIWSARHADVAAPVKLEFTLVDLDGQSLSPDEVAADSPESLYSARLIAPDGQDEVLKLAVEGATFTASGGVTMTQEGTYAFEITANPDAFKAGYIPGDTTPVTVPFERYDAFWTKPSTFKTIAIVLSVLLAALVGWLIYMMTGVPKGTLEITEPGRASKTLAGPFSVDHHWRVAKIKGKELQGLGIGYIVVKKAPPLEGERAVFVRVVDTDKLEIFDSMLEVDQPTFLLLPDGQEVDIIYH